MLRCLTKLEEGSLIKTAQDSLVREGVSELPRVLGQTGMVLTKGDDHSIDTAAIFSFAGFTYKIGELVKQ